MNPKYNRVLRRKRYEKESQSIQARRAKLMKALGDKCQRCGSILDLEFDHIHGRNWTPREVSQHKRMEMYEFEASMGLLRVLCSVCNGGYRPPAYKRRKGQSILDRILNGAVSA